MVFLVKGTKTYKLRVDHPDGRHAVLTTGCVTEEDALDVELTVHRWQGKKGHKYRRLDLVDAAIEKRVPLPELVEAYLDNTVDELLVARAPKAAEVSLLEQLDQYVAVKKKSKKGGGQAETYKKQILTLFPDGQLTRERFDRKEVWTRLDALEVDAPTKNRYRTAASWFAKNLVKNELLDRNFVREIEGYGENEPRLVYYELDDAKRLITALEQPYAAIAAMALGFCAEWGAISRAITSDFALETDPVVAHVRGTKRAWRDRFVPLIPELAWTLERIRPALTGKLPTALLINGVPEWRAIDAIRAKATELKIAAVGEDEFGQHSIHDWRHTHAVAVLRSGYIEQIAADHLGHKDTSLVRRIYGRFKPTKLDYAKAAGTSVTPIKAPKPAKKAGSVSTKSITSATTPRRARGDKR